ncbi:MAG TPA: DUF3800 domain-containing protein [Bryobacteraceae bacterium]
MLKAYIDEASSGDSSGMFVVAGYGTFCPSWIPLTENWCEVLSHTPRLEYYKTHDLLSPDWRKEHGWTEHQALTKIRKLAGVVEEFKHHLLFTAYASVQQSEFYRARETAPRLKKTLHHPYQFCFSALVTEALKFLGSAGICGDMMDFVLDRNDAVTDDSERIMRGVRRLMSNRAMADMLGDAVPQDDRSFAGLQIADMLAARVRDHVSRPGNAEARKALLQVQTSEYIPIRVTRSGLEEFFAYLPSLGTPIPTHGRSR